MSTLTTAGITFGDATSQTTAATAAALVTTTNVLNATAGASAGAVGSYAFCAVSSDMTFGSTKAGSVLQPASVYQLACYVNYTSSGSLSGTWRSMGWGAIGGGTARVTLWLRIS